jgi:hypothetical protein
VLFIFKEVIIFRIEEHQLENKDKQLRESYAQVLKDLHAKSEMIKSLYQKISFLQGALKLKNLKITALTNQLVQNSSDTFGSSSVRLKNIHTTKGYCKRLRTQM